MDLLSEHPFGAGGLNARMYRLDNGLQVLLLRDPAAPIFAYQTWFRVGSRDEREGKTGMAHLFEHLMFNETESLKQGVFDRKIEERGGNNNAATSTDYTYYQNNLPAADLELCVQLEADRMQNLVVRESQVESEREVVMNERRFRVEDDVDGFMGEELFRLAYTQHPYHWPIIGWMRDIKAFTVEDAVAFYRTYYAPNNATIVVAGDLDEGLTLALIQKHYGHLPAQDIPMKKIAAEPEQTEERRQSYEKPVATDKLLLGYKAPSILDRDHLHMQVLSDILFGGASSRCYRDLFVERELVSSIGASVTQMRDPGLWEIGASLQRGHSAEEALAAIDEHVARIQAEGPTQAELDRSRARFLTHFYSGMRSADGKAESLGHYETAYGDYKLLFEVPAQLKALTTAEVQLAAQTYARPERRTVVIARPSAEAAGDEAGDDGDEAAQAEETSP